MSGNELQFAWLSDARLAAHALSPMPVWLWSADATRVLWANPTAAAIFDAASPGALASRRFDPQHVSAAQILRMAGTLPHGGAPRLERLRGFGASVGGTLMCYCSRIALADNSAGILVVSTERSAKELSLPERTRRVLADFERPAAIFTADGELIDATASARKRMADNRDLIALGAEKLAREVSRNGKAEGAIPAGAVTLLKLGAGATVTLLVVFEAEVSSSHAGTRASEAAAAIAASSAPNRAAPEPRTRQVPFRFVWRMDAATRFTHGTQEFAQLIGPKTAAVLDRTWAEIADALKLDSEGRIASALASRETWSGIVVHWPVDDSSERVAIDMSGLPVFDNERQFSGYRGFGICRDVDRLTQRENKPSAVKADQPEGKVLPFPSPPPPPPVAPAEPAPSLSAGEHSAFQELARELSARLKNPTKSKTAEASAESLVAPVPAEPLAAPVPAEPPKAARNGDAARDTIEGRPILDRLPIGLLVYRLNNLIYANRAFLDWTGYPTLDALTEAG
ncbi:MAG: PAS domain-containing protein, partial [Rhizobiales bacterium]|nr:PAS domain-containing protein [Hyphomicrobiales bacterium]